MLTRRSIVLGPLALLVATCVTYAATPEKRPVEIHIKTVHCAGCAKKICTKLKGMDGVEEVKVDVKKDIAYITTATGKSPSLRGMWEAVEAAGFKPVKLVSSKATYTAKPKT